METVKQDGRMNTENYQQRKLRQALLMKRLTNFIPLVGTAVLAALFFAVCIVKGYEIDTNLIVVIKRAMIIGFLATGASFIFAIGSFDLSLGANMLVSAAVGATVYNATGSLILMLAVCIAVCVVLSLINASLASVFNLPVFVMTIAMMSVFTALATLIISNVDANGIDTRLSRPSNPDNVYYQVIGNMWFQLAMLVIFVLLCAFLFDYMKMGRRQKFIGGNPVCARLTGIAPMGITIFSFTVAGVGVGMAAYFTILSGGPRTKALAAFIGGFSMAFLDQFMTLLLLDTNTGSAVTQVVKAVLFLTVVTLLSLSYRTKLLPR